MQQLPSMPYLKKLLDHGHYIGFGKLYSKPLPFAIVGHPTTNADYVNHPVFRQRLSEAVISLNQIIMLAKQGHDIAQMDFESSLPPIDPEDSLGKWVHNVGVVQILEQHGDLEGRLLLRSKPQSNDPRELFDYAGDILFSVGGSSILTVYNELDKGAKQLGDIHGLF